MFSCEERSACGRDLELTMGVVVVIVLVEEEGQSQARGVTGPEWTRYV